MEDLPFLHANIQVQPIEKSAQLRSSKNKHKKAMLQGDYRVPSLIYR
jgi:hypothetical protein